MFLYLFVCLLWLLDAMILYLNRSSVDIKETGVSHGMKESRKLDNGAWLHPWNKNIDQVFTQTALQTSK